MLIPRKTVIKFTNNRYPIWYICLSGPKHIIAFLYLFIFGCLYANIMVHYIYCLVITKKLKSPTKLNKNSTTLMSPVKNKTSPVDEQRLLSIQVFIFYID